MSVTVQELLYKARALLDEYTDEGTIIPQSDVIDIEEKMILFLDMGQKELYKTGRTFQTLEFANKPITPIGGLFSGFEMKENTGEVEYFPDESGTSEAKSYHIEADQTHEILIQEYESGVWQTLYTHSATAEEGFQQYKGNITTTTSGNKIRMKISSDFYFKHINRAFFPYKFVTVPDYRPWVRKTMPDDFRLLDAVVEEYSPRQYAQSTLYKWEEPNVFVYNYFYEGNFRIKYKPVPTTLTSRNQVLQIDDITADALAYFAASWIAPYENQSMTNPLFQKYTELKLESIITQPNGEESIIDVYGVGYYA